MTRVFFGCLGAKHTSVTEVTVAFDDDNVRGARRPAQGGRPKGCFRGAAGPRRLLPEGEGARG
jgi:hypothetical protein